jgi:hypothetical protein
MSEYDRLKFLIENGRKYRARHQYVTNDQLSNMIGTAATDVRIGERMQLRMIEVVGKAVEIPSDPQIQKRASNTSRKFEDIHIVTQ